MILSQRSFAGGELSPSLYSRVDTVKYATGARALKNMQVMKSGGAENRPGSLFIGEVADSTKRTRLIPFIFNSDQTYILEFSHERIRFIRLGEYVMDSNVRTVDTFSEASPALVVLDDNNADWLEGDHVVFTSLVTNARINNRPMKMLDPTLNSFDLHYLNEDPYPSLGVESVGSVSRVYSIESPYTEDELEDIYFAQQGDVLVLAHPDHPLQQLSRLDHDDWSIDAYDIGPSIDPPLNAAADGGSGFAWVITAVAEETFEESTPSNVATSSTDPASSPRTLNWDAVVGAREYNVYKFKNGIYGYIGTAVGTTFIDNGIPADVTDTPPIVRDPFASTDNYPAVVSYIQQRLMLGFTNNNPEGIWGSKSGLFHNFSVRSPLQADDAITFSMVGRQVNAVRHILELEHPVILTQGGEHIIGGDEAGILRPGEINPKQFGYSGASKLIPIVIGGNAIFVQSLGGVVRDIAARIQSDGYNGNDLTTFSTHLFKNKTLVDWAYQQTPDSIIWAVRDDGTLLGLTYVPEQQIFAWHRHNFASLGSFGAVTNSEAGIVESVAVIPENGRHAVYLVIQRENGAVNPFGEGPNRGVKRYVERLSNRSFSDIKLDAIFLDSVLSYDGRNADDEHTMSIPAGNWDVGDEFTLTSSDPFFASTDVGNHIHFTDEDTEEIYRLKIKSFSSSTQVVVELLNKRISVVGPPNSSAIWSRAVDELTGLWHLSQTSVSVMADGFVVANPINSQYPLKQVSSDGVLSLDEPYSVIHVGLPYVADLETLDIDTPDGETIVDKKKVITSLSVRLDETRGGWYGRRPDDDDDNPASLSDLVEIKVRDDESYDDPVELKSDVADVNIQGEWNSNGRILIRQVDPLPIRVLSVHPAGMIPFRG